MITAFLQYEFHLRFKSIKKASAGVLFKYAQNGETETISPVGSTNHLVDPL